MKPLNKWQSVLFCMGAVFILLGAAAHIFVPMVSCIVYSMGAVAFASMRIRMEYQGRNITLVRLRRQQLLASACFVLTAILMGMQDLYLGFVYRNEWVMSLAVGCVLELYTSWRVPQELSKN